MKDKEKKAHEAREPVPRKAAEVGVWRFPPRFLPKLPPPLAAQQVLYGPYRHVVHTSQSG